VQVKNNKVMRVVPLENEAVNECWIADRDRFSYEALNGEDRLTAPMLKQGGEWKTVDWQTALEYVANGLRQIKADHGAQSIGTLASPHSTVEELYLAGALMRGLGSENIDYRLRNAEFPAAQGARWLGTSIASLSSVAARAGRGLQPAQGPSAVCAAHPPGHQAKGPGLRHHRHRAGLGHAAGAQRRGARRQLGAGAGRHGRAIAAEKGVEAPAAGNATDAAKAIAQSLLGGERKAILLGNAAAHHAKAPPACWRWPTGSAQQTGATVGYLTEAANTVGAQLAGAQPGNGGLNAGQMLERGRGPQGRAAAQHRAAL
jgi:NADH-quinone oxidoreductase subunit G